MKQLSELSNEVKIRKLASLFFTISEIAVFCDLDPDELRREIVDNPGSYTAKAYRKGVMDSQIRLRYDTSQFAFAGNPQAEEEMKTFLTRQKLDENA